MKKPLAVLAALFALMSGASAYVSAQEYGPPDGQPGYSQDHRPPAMRHDERRHRPMARRHHEHRRQHMWQDRDYRAREACRRRGIKWHWENGRCQGDGR